MKRVGIIVGIVLIAVAYIVGFWPQHQQAQQARRQLTVVTTQLDQAQGKLRLATLQNRLLALIGKTSAKDYGQASAISTQFFNAVRQEEMRRSDEPGVKMALDSILKQRDTVTSDLAKGDASALDVLNGLEGTMFKLVDQSLGEAGAAGGGS
ncbi:MAG TPA: hypothetical protein VNJ52_12370 [Patescibacteria group bacterium]|nr:hypothetical protein [Patescibacteria group bacterium]